MAKKKEDLGGVWRTVGGRRIFIKDGQDLYEAMNDSGKFTNLKKENFKRKKNEDGSYKHQKEFEQYIEANKATEKTKDWHLRKAVNGDEEAYQRAKEVDTLTSLRKADNWNDINSAIDNIKDEKIKTMMKKEAQKLEENENGAWKSADYLAKQYNFYKEDSYHEKSFVDEVKNYKQKDQKAYHSAKEALLSRFNHTYNDGDTKKPDYEKRMSKIRVLEESEDYVLYASKDEEGFVNIQTVTSWNPDSRFDRPPEIYYEQDYKGNIKAGSATVNWGAYGSQDPKTTKEFIDKLTKAQEFADRINKGKDYSKMWDNSNKEKGIYTDKNGSKIGHSMVVQYATANHLTIEEAKKILGVK